MSPHPNSGRTFFKMSSCNCNHMKKPIKFPSFLNSATKADKWEARDDAGRLVVAVHAILVESGFLIPGSVPGSPLPKGWGAMLSTWFVVPYTISGLKNEDDNGKIANLSFLITERYVWLCGAVSRHDGKKSEMYRLCLDVACLAPSAKCFVGDMGDEEEKAMFDLWKIVRDGIFMPLVIDMSELNGFILPLCFWHLPCELKLKIMELLPGNAIVRVGCVSSKLQKPKCKEVFIGDNVVYGMEWKKKFIVFLSSPTKERENRLPTTLSLDINQCCFRRMFLL